MAGIPEMQEQFPARPWMAGIPEMQEQFPGWIAGMPEMQEPYRRGHRMANAGTAFPSPSARRCPKGG
jgi:hypothetical protein